MLNIFYFYTNSHLQHDNYFSEVIQLINKPYMTYVYRILMVSYNKSGSVLVKHVSLTARILLERTLSNTKIFGFI